MNDVKAAASLERRIAEWRSALESAGDVAPEAADELEAHLAEEIHALRASGLTGEEALIVATRRIGHTHHLSREYFKINVNRLWKQLAVPADAAAARRDVVIAVALTVVAALLAQVPFLLGGSYLGERSVEWGQFASLWILPSLAGWFIYRHRSDPRRIAPVAGVLAAIHLYLALVPFDDGSATRVLVMLHVPFLSWVVLLPLALDRAWWSLDGMVHFLRLTAEAFIYTVLLYLGGIVLLALTVAILESVGVVGVDRMVEHLSIAGLFGAPVVGVILADRKRQTIESLAPILARIFNPLFVVAIATFLVLTATQGVRPADDRSLLLVANILLLLVVAMVFYDVSAREAMTGRRVMDALNSALVVLAVMLDAVALAGIASRVVSFGATPNRAALLGLNAILLAHLGTLAAVYLRYILRRTSFRPVEAVVVRPLPIYAAWLAVVVVAFPLLFRGA